MGSSGIDPAVVPRHQPDEEPRRDAATGLVAAYRYVREGIDLLADQAPDLHQVITGPVEMGAQGAVAVNDSMPEGCAGYLLPAGEIERGAGGRMSPEPAHPPSLSGERVVRFSMSLRAACSALSATTRWTKMPGR